MNKKTIYNAYGIEYKNGKILTPDGWTAPLLKKGNSKTGKSVFTYSQLAGREIWGTKYGPVCGTCAGACEHCYACTGFYQMQSVKNALALNTIITRCDLDFKKRAVIAQIKADNIQVIRIHAAGDFDSIADVNIWRDIANACPGSLFWTYTKRTWTEIGELNKLPNINIVPSIISGRVNFGTCSDLLELKSACPGAYVCPCGFTETHCENCKACATKENVIFLLHSAPDYNGQDDPLYNDLLEIVNSQNVNI